jgi:hypothetical protein
LNALVPNVDFQSLLIVAYPPPILSSFLMMTRSATLRWPDFSGMSRAVACSCNAAHRRVCDFYGLHYSVCKSAFHLDARSDCALNYVVAGKDVAQNRCWPHTGSCAANIA